MAAPKSEFKNVSPGHIGVQVHDHGKGGFKGITVKSDETVWLDEDEQVATANAPRKDEDNPFIDPGKQLELVTPATSIVNRRQIGDTQQVQPSDIAAAKKAEDAAKAAKDKSAAEAAVKARKAKEAKEVTEETRGEHSQKEIDAQNAKAAAARATQPPAAPAEDLTATAPKPAGKAAEGTRSATEEVGTPEAVPSS